MKNFDGIRTYIRCHIKFKFYNPNLWDRQSLYIYSLSRPAAKQRRTHKRHIVA